MSSQNHITTFPATYHVPQDWIFQSGISNYQVQSIGTRGRVKFSLPFRGIQFKLVYILAIWFCNKNYLLASLLVVKSDKSLKGRIKTLLEYLTVWNERLGNELGGLLSLLLNNQESTMPLQISINTDSRGTGQYTECYWRGWVQQHTRGMHAYMLFFKKKLYIKKNNEKVCNCGLSSANNLYSKGQKCTFTVQTADTYFAAVHAVSEQWETSSNIQTKQMGWIHPPPTKTSNFSTVHVKNIRLFETYWIFPRATVISDAAKWNAVLTQ